MITEQTDSVNDAVDELSFNGQRQRDVVILNAVIVDTHFVTGRHDTMKSTP